MRPAGWPAPHPRPPRREGQPYTQPGPRRPGSVARALTEPLHARNDDPRVLISKFIILSLNVAVFILHSLANISQICEIYTVNPIFEPNHLPHRPVFPGLLHSKCCHN